MPCSPARARFGHQVGQILELDPVELDVLPGGEMTVIAVIDSPHMGEHAQLGGRQRAVRDGDPQHIGMQLQIDAVHEPQRLEFLFRQFARDAPRHLAAKLGYPLGHQGAIELVVDVHAYNPAVTGSPALAGSTMVGPASLMRSRRLPGRAPPFLSSCTGAT